MRKKITTCLMVALLSLTLNPIESKAATEVSKPASVTLPKAALQAKVRVMTVRLEEINAMDKSNLTASERRALRNEVKAINEQMKAASLEGGVYISAGALILIIILLIIFF